eukprot:CAMPEP_0117682774 /NCGR_PEP_ID=MMETSP0804-20121206/19906_1 /TAXON_ID=1074897 /ORGANISM="Tetraselmis astigmatica, Strain CCMP880" /LENGTH=658 /DNA_ID=CAMNT_0005493043 /DNA_START=195 /DNA_END=2172 /DNA_ORIENTATION=+
MYGTEHRRAARGVGMEGGNIQRPSVHGAHMPGVVSGASAAQPAARGQQAQEHQAAAGEGAGGGKANAQLNRYKMLQSDLREADRVIHALRAVLTDRGVTKEEMEGAIDQKVLQGDRLAGASRELLQREIRQLKSLQSKGLITSRTHAAVSSELNFCQAPRPAHPQELSAHSELIARIQSVAERLHFASEEVLWEVPLPPETAENECQVEGLEPTPAEQLSEEISRIKDVIVELRGAHQKVQDRVMEATGIIDENLSDQERRAEMKLNLEDAKRRAELAERRAAEAQDTVELLREETQRLREALKKEQQELQAVNSVLAVKEKTLKDLQDRVANELQEIRTVQVNTTREAMSAMTEHHERQAVVINDTRSAAVDAKAAAEQQTGRIDALAVAQARNMELGNSALQALIAEQTELRVCNTRLERENRNMSHRVAAQAALVGHVRRLDRDLADALGTKVAAQLQKTLPEKLRAAERSTMQSSTAGEDTAPGLWAYAACDESTTTEEAEPASVVARQSWRKVRVPMYSNSGPRMPRGWTDAGGRRGTRANKESRQQRKGGALFERDSSKDNHELWESLEELRPSELAKGAVVYPQQPKASETVVHWLGSSEACPQDRGTAAQPSEVWQEAECGSTDGLLVESRALRCELTSLLNSAREWETA